MMRSHRVERCTNTIAYHHDPFRREPGPLHNLLVGIVGYCQHAIRPLSCRTYHQTIVRVLGPTRFRGYVQVDQVMDSEDERARTPDRRIKARAEIDQRTERAQDAGQEYRLQGM
jgi:hypothetical protein